MIYILLSHPVQDFDAWKSIFESDQERASAADIQLIKLLRSKENPNEVSIFCSAQARKPFMVL